MDYDIYSNVGAFRDHNEDSVLLMEVDFKDETYTIALVCDGVGGGIDGKFASSEIVRSVKSIFSGSLGIPADVSAVSYLQTLLVKGIEQANSVIYEKYLNQIAKSASTCTGVVIGSSQYGYVHIGDTRLYEITNSGYRQVTSDETWVAKQIQQGLMTEAEAKTHPRRHIITNAVGSHERLRCNKSKIANSGSNFLLTSDGYSELLNDARISMLQSGETDLEHWAKVMMREGQKDNLSAILIKR